MSANRRVHGVLLVHGAWHTGAGTWGDVARILEGWSVPVAVADLHRRSLPGDVAAAAEALATLGDRPVVACGHSYGGTVITALPTQRLAHLVFVAATMPDSDETTLGLMASAPATTLMEAIRPVAGSDAMAVIDPEVAAQAFYGHSAPSVAAEHVAGLVPQCMSPGDQLPGSVAWRTVPSTYVVCEDDQALNPELQRRLARRATHFETWPSDHSPFLQHAGRLADLLRALAASG